MRILLLLFAFTLSCLAQPLSPNDPAFLQSTSPLRRGLAGYWRLEEASGTRYDCSQYGNHLTDNNSVGQGTGIQGKDATFVKASDQYLSIPSTPSLTLGADSFSIACWVKLTTTNALHELVTKYNTSANGEYAIQYASAAARFAWFVNTNVTTTVGLNEDNTPNPVAGVWYFIFAWVDRSIPNIGISVNNGVPSTLAVNGFGNVTSTAVFEIGWRDSHPLGEPLDGQMDEVGIWKRVLTAAELTQLYNAGLGTHFPWAHP